MNLPKVENMQSSNGNKIANQFIIWIDKDEHNDGAEIFQSYKSIIATRTIKGITLDEYYWNYSRTTSKYRNEFLGENTEETRKKIKSGEYKLADLN